MMRRYFYSFSCLAMLFLVFAIPALAFDTVVET